MKDVRIAARIPKHDNKAIVELVNQGRFVNKSDFFRHAIKRLLEVKP